MANTFKFGNKKWATKEGSVLAYNDENNNFKPLPFDFTRASSATRVNENGLIEVVGSNEPRIDYLNNADGHLLLEPSRSNIMLYSEEFDNAYWTKNNATVLANNAISPDGTQNADKITFLTSSGEIVKTTTFTSGVQYTMSFYAKTESGTLTFNYGNIDYAVVSGTATDEWQRFVVTQTAPVTTRFPKIQTTETGSLLLWGLQIEQGSYATSYIPTSGSAVTRNGELSFEREDMVDLNLYSSEMTWFYDINLFNKEGGSTVAPRLINTSDNQVFIGLNIPDEPNTDLRIRHKDGTTAANTNSVTFTNGGRFKIAVKITGTTGTAYINGTNVGTFTTLAASNYNKYENSGSNSNNINDMRFYNTALSDSELQALTS